MTDAKLISSYMAGIQRSKDGRWRHVNQFALAEALRKRGADDSLAMLTAQAARRVAESIQVHFAAASKQLGGGAV